MIFVATDFRRAALGTACGRRLTYEGEEWSAVTMTIGKKMLKVKSSRRAVSEARFLVFRGEHFIITPWKECAGEGERRESAL